MSDAEFKDLCESCVHVGRTHGYQDCRIRPHDCQSNAQRAVAGWLRENSGRCAIGCPSYLRQERPRP